MHGGVSPPPQLRTRLETPWCGRTSSITNSWRSGQKGPVTDALIPQGNIPRYRKILTSRVFRPTLSQTEYRDPSELPYSDPRLVRRFSSRRNQSTTFESNSPYSNLSTIPSRRPHSLRPYSRALHPPAPARNIQIPSTDSRPDRKIAYFGTGGKPALASSQQARTFSDDCTRAAATRLCLLILHFFGPLSLRSFVRFIVTEDGGTPSQRLFRPPGRDE
jgi:hypothetical protein